MLTITHIGKMKGMMNQHWFTIAGYTTNLPEIARIFGVHLGTLRARNNAGWYLPAAILATKDIHWTSDAINAYAASGVYDEPFLAKLQSFFKRPPVL